MSNTTTTSATSAATLNKAGVSFASSAQMAILLAAALAKHEQQAK